MTQRYYAYRDEVSVAAGATVTLLEFITAAQVPATVFEVSLDLENATVANSAPTPMAEFIAERSSTAMTTPTALTPSNLGVGQGTPQTVVNGANAAENFTVVANTRVINRRVPATGSLWLPYPLGREIVIPIGTASFRFRLANTGTGSIALLASIGVSFEE
jgi:hypothetical protein